jgi:uncharacterized membrane protein
MQTNAEPVVTRVPVAGHSLHRWLVGIPAVLYIGTVVLYVLYATTHDVMWMRDGIVTNVVAIVAAALVAIPGVLDFLAIPNGHPARNLGIAHGSLMVVVLSLFTANLAFHHRALCATMKGATELLHGMDPSLALGISGVGLALVVAGAVGGFLLAHRFHIGDVPTGAVPPSMRPRFR